MSLRGPTCEMVIFMLLWVPLRLLLAFPRTYMSRNKEVRKAGLVADCNAVALAVAVALLLTSQIQSEPLSRQLNISYPVSL